MESVPRVNSSLILGPPFQILRVARGAALAAGRETILSIEQARSLQQTFVTGLHAAFRGALCSRHWVRDRAASGR
jgi:hypothetical protein